VTGPGTSSTEAPVDPDVWVRGGLVVDPASGTSREADVLVRGGRVAAVGEVPPPPAGATVVDARGALVSPRFWDLHVHLREPGGEDAETIATGVEAALAGGYGLVCAMPNTDPVADRPEVLARVRAAAARAGPCAVLPVSALSVGLLGRELVDFAAQAAAGAVAFSDDGAWLADDALADRAFSECARAGWLVMQHCEDPALSRGGCLHDAAATRAHGLLPLAREAEDRAVARDVSLAARRGTRLHVCHVSTRGAVEALRDAKARGVLATGEAAPHHLTLTVEDAVAGGPDRKMKPPLREDDDVSALVEALADGTIDAVATDHAPHAPARKAAGLEKAPFGAIGLETAFPVLYTRLVETGRCPLERLVAAMTTGPAGVLRRSPPALAPGSVADFVVVDLASRREVDRDRLRSKSRNTPFPGWVLAGWPRTVYAEGRLRLL
jgi:dihydroorotase